MSLSREILLKHYKKPNLKLDNEKKAKLKLKI